MAAQNNVFALVDSNTGTTYAVVVDAANPPSTGSPNNAYWKTAITTNAGNPFVAVPIPVATYNITSAAGLAALINTLFNTLNLPISLG